MSEAAYPTQAEYQEALNTIFAHDPELYHYLTNYGQDEPTEFDLDVLEERIRLMEEEDYE